MKPFIVAAALAAAFSSAFAQSAWPTKPVKIINSFPPGGPSDTIARSVADVLQKQFNQPFVVENKPGAAGNIGTEAVAKSPADGHTLLFGIDSTFTINPHIYKGMAFKPAELPAYGSLARGKFPALVFSRREDGRLQLYAMSQEMSKVLNYWLNIQAM